MAGDFKASLKVNGQPVALTGFPEEFLARTVAGAVSSLKKTGDIRELELTMNYGKVKLTLNGDAIPLGPFPGLVITNTLVGMVGTLKGVEGKINGLEIKMQAV